ncbi:PPC domain-containing DNA-binding protein [Halobacteriovorax sp. DPLXC-1]|uniref:PPC domain-containing DNA-binding protein n=1 Tax=Halobacteriovorax sp. DPLXC-1 TaxID=3110771 RepID=UPI002FEEBF42
MKYIKQEECYLIRLYKDEDLFSALEEFAVAEELSAGMLKGIGALKEVELGFYHLETKTYDRKEFNGDFELLSLDGNLSYLDGRPFFHIHTVLGDEDFSCKGGHLFRAKVAVTTEIYFFPITQRIERKMDEEIGLNLLSLPDAFSRCGIKG